MKGKTTFLAKAFLMLFAVLFSFTGARAQKALPYEYGFETTLADEGWTIVDGAGNTGITSNAAYIQNGGYAFQFMYNTTPPQYLISPELTGTEGGVTVSFSYKAPGQYVETFAVGYSTTTNETSAFEWEAEITSPKEWTECSNTFPAGTKYVAVKYTANDQLRLCLDDFSFTTPTAVVIAKPTGLKVSYTGGTTATVSWSSDASAFDIDVNDVVTENVDNPYNMTGLSLGTTYTIKVRAKEGTEVSGWTAPISFTTEFGVFSLPYTDGFEDGIAAWTLVDCASGTGISTTPHEGTKGFTFKYNSNPPQYLISPEFDGASAMTVSFWYRVQSANYPETFQVGYSTTTKDVGEFTWGDEVTATNNNDWLQYEADFPAGTKFVAVRYNSNDMFYLFVDDFSFTVNSGLAKPTGLKVDNIGPKSADFSWTENGTATAWEICLNGDETNLIAADSNPFTLKGLTPETDYTAKVRAVSGGLKSGWSNEVAFTTDVAFPTPKNLAVTPAANSAEVTWTGTGDKYNLRYAEQRGFFEDFENGLDQWTIYTEGEAPQTNGWYTINPTSGLSFESHSGEYCASAWSWNSSAYNANNWLVTPQVTFGTTLKFWVRTNATYPDSYEVLLSNSGNATTDFTVELQAMAPAPAVDEWNEVVIDLSAYAGQDGYIAIHHVDNDMNYLLIDDFSITDDPVWVTANNVTSPYTIEGLTPETKYQVEVQAIYSDGKSEWAGTSFTTIEDVPTPTNLATSGVTWGVANLSWTENGTATAWEICLNDDENNLIAADSNPFQLTGLTPETDYTAKVRAVKGEKKSKWSNEASFTTEIRFYPPADLAAANVTTTSAEISWTTTDAAATGFELQYAEGNVFGSLLRYDDGTVATNVGSSSTGTWTWGVMYPGSMVNATQLAKVIIYETGYNTEDITINIYQGGDDAPGTQLYTETVTPVGGFHEVTLASTVAITPGKNLWITLTETGTYVMAACTTTEPNNQWVENNGWANIGDLASSLAGYGWMIRAEINDGIDPATVTWTSVADVTSPYELTGLNPETTYTASVKAVYGTEGESKWTSTVFATLSENPVPSNIEADLAADGATLTWDGTGDSYNVQYRTASVAPVLFTDDFENGLDNWTIVTAGEGPGWVIGDETGTNAATAYSWNSSGSYAADNWLISPAIELGGSISFAAANSSQFPDAYEVLLSTTGNDIADFTETLQAMSTTTGNIDIDLSAYSGTGYIAFHHVTTDMYLLAIDNVVIYGAGSPAGAWQEMAVTGTTATISGLATNNAYEYQIQSVKGANTSAWSDVADFALLTLADDADNTSLVNSFNGYLAHVTLADRTLYKDGKWNTITVPFTLTPAELAASPLADADIRTLSGIAVSDYTATLNFTEAGAIETAWGVYYGGVPYLVKWDADADIVNPEFANVVIESTLYNMSGSDTNTGISVAFKGTYAPISYTAEDQSILFVGSENKLYWPQAGAKIGAQHAYFQIEGTSAEVNPSSSIKEFIMNFGDEDATGISLTPTLSEGEGEWYDLSGRKLAGKPSMKGIFIVNGKKVLK